MSEVAEARLEAARAIDQAFVAYAEIVNAQATEAFEAGERAAREAILAEIDTFRADYRHAMESLGHTAHPLVDATFAGVSVRIQQMDRK